MFSEKCRKLLISTVLAAGLLALQLSDPVQAATASSTIAVSATVLSFCTIITTALQFGNYTSVVNTSTATVTVACTTGTTYNVGLDVGLGGSTATVAARQMTFGTNKLPYLLTSDMAHAVQWGPTIGTNTVAGVATGLPQTLTVYGQIAAGLLVAPGLYGDTVTATITY